MTSCEIIVTITNASSWSIEFKTNEDHFNTQKKSLETRSRAATLVIIFGTYRVRNTNLNVAAVLPVDVFTIQHVLSVKVFVF